MQTAWKKNTVLFLASQALSLIGTMLVQYAIMWHIVLKTQSGSMITVFVIAGVLPTFFTSLFGGVWADRYNKKHLINLADGSIAVVSLAIALTLLAGYDSTPILLVAAAVRALGQGIQQPAVNSLIPLIVPEDRLLKINGINSSIQSGMFLMSPIVSAWLMSAVPLETIFFIDVATAAAAIAILYFIVKVPHIEKKSKNIGSTSHFRDLLNGLKYIKSQRYLFLILIIEAVYMIAMSPVAFLSPLQVTRNFGSDLWRLSAVEIAFAGGMVLGGILVGIWCWRNRIYSIGVSSCIFGVLTVMLGLLADFVPYLICMAVCGISAPYYNAPSMTLLQEKVAPEYLGRVLSIFTMSGSVLMPLGMLVYGPLSDAVNINLLLIATGIIMLVAGLPFFINKTLTEAGRQSK